MIPIKRFLRALRVRTLPAGLPAFAQPRYAAVVLVASLLVKHPGVHDVPDRHVQVVGEEVLQARQGLVSCGLQGSKGRGSQMSLRSHRHPDPSSFNL